MVDAKWWLQQIDASLDARGDIAPPWARCPDIPLGSIGWRMGFGEHWMMLWHTWLSRQPSDRAWRIEYLRRHPPAPRRWADTVACVLDPGWDDLDDEDEDDDEDDDEERDEFVELRALGLIRDDAAFLAWRRLHGDAPRVPWADPSYPRTLADAAMYGGRELTFFTRWCAQRRAAGTLDAWLDADGRAAPAPIWRPVDRALRTGTCPDDLVDRLAGDGWTALALTLAADGLARAPWRLGQSVASLRDDDDDDDDDAVSYADAWSWWTFESFDDRASLRAYLDAQGPAPDEWSEALSRALALLDA